MLSGSVLTQRDKQCTVALLLLCCLGALLYIDFKARPFEDAAMLMRYSQHVAQGNGIVFNIGAKPVDGATDFLFMVSVAGLQVIGLPIAVGVRLLGFVSHVLTVLVVYWGVRRSYAEMPPSEILAFISAAYLAVGPGMCYVSMYFGTPFFALWAAIAWYFAMRIRMESQRNSLAWGFGGASLLMSLTRPEGVFLTVFMLVALIFLLGGRGASKVLYATAILFAVVGGSYFFWRWWYFGYPLPNPYYIKGNSLFYGSSMGKSLGNTLALTLPCVLAFVLAFRNGETARFAQFVLIPVAGWVLIWGLLSNEMNFLARYQYGILPLVLISWPRMVVGLWNEWRLPQLTGLAPKSRAALRNCCVVLFMFLMAYQYQWSLTVKSKVGRDGLCTAALMLHEYKSKGYTLATTEAGLLPFYSEWNAIDTWGLNDKWIAHHGHVTESYLDRYSPALLVLHAPLTRGNESNDPLGHDPRTWGGMIAMLKRYAASRNYVLAAAWGESPDDTHSYFVRADCPDCAELIRKLRQLDYTGEAGQRWYNWALPVKQDL
jgi:hypothetical protein